MPQNARTTLRSVTLLIPFFVIFFVIFFPMGARAEKQDVTLRAADGFTLKGTFYSAEKPGPGRLHPSISKFGYYSGGTEEEGEASDEDSPETPILGVACDEDSSSPPVTKELVALSASRDSQVEMFTNAGHAASIFAKQPNHEP